MRRSLAAALTLLSLSLPVSAGESQVLARAICFGQGQAVETYLAEARPNLDAPLEVGPRLSLRPLSLALSCLQSVRQSALPEHVRALGSRPEREDVMVERLLRLGADPVYQEPDLAMQTPLHLVMALPADQHKELLELLLKFDAVPALALRDTAGRTPAELARTLSPGLAGSLQRYQPTGLSDFNLRFEPFAYDAGSRQLEALARQDALLEAVDRKRLPAAMALLEQGQSPDLYLLDPPGRPLLHQLALDGRRDWLELILAHGADIRIKDFAQAEVLHLLAASGRPDLMAWLVEQGASLHARDASGESPLFAAVRAADPAAIAELLRLGADMTQRNHLGQSALQLSESLAAERPERYRRIRELLRSPTP